MTEPVASARRLRAVAFRMCLPTPSASLPPPCSLNIPLMARPKSRRSPSDSPSVLVVPCILAPPCICEGFAIDRVRLHPVARLPRDQRRRDDRATESPLGQVSIEPVPAWPRLVAEENEKAEAEKSNQEKETK